jgi:hypothetical protein
MVAAAPILLEDAAVGVHAHVVPIVGLRIVNDDVRSHGSGTGRSTRRARLLELIGMAERRPGSPEAVLRMRVRYKRPARR